MSEKKTLSGSRLLDVSHAVLWEPDGKYIFEDLNLQVGCGDHTLVTGTYCWEREGLFRLVSGLCRPDAGTAAITQKHSALSVRMDMLEHLSVAGHMDLYRRWQSEKTDTKVLAEIAQLADIVPLMGVNALRLTLLEKLKCMLAMGFAGEPSLLILEGFGEQLQSVSAARKFSVQRFWQSLDLLCRRFQTTLLMIENEDVNALSFKYKWQIRQGVLTEGMNDEKSKENV